MRNLTGSNIQNKRNMSRWMRRHNVSAISVLAVVAVAIIFIIMGTIEADAKGVTADTSYYNYGGGKTVVCTDYCYNGTCTTVCN